METTIDIAPFFDKSTSTMTYCVWDKQSGDAAVIDPVMSYDSASGNCSLAALTPVTDWIRQHGLKLAGIVETHVHADHLSGSQLLKNDFPDAKLVIGKEIVEVQKIFQTAFHISESEGPSSKNLFDKLVEDGTEFSLGSLKFRALSTPGHTPACYSFQVGNAVFTGDCLFMPDFGVGRCDFPGGDAEALYDSVVEKIFSLDDNTELYTGHDYQPGGRELLFHCTVKEQKESNIHINEKTLKEDFVKFRTERDAQLSVPKLLYPSLFVNIRAGHLPEPEANGKSYTKMPIQLKGSRS